MKKVLGLSIVAALVFLMSTPLAAWKPNQHAALGWAIWNELQANGNEGRVLINGIRYPINAEAKTAILAYPIHFLMGCFGPDAYPDIYFGQCVIHPDNYWIGDTPSTISDDWLYQVLLKGREHGGAALAFAYGFLAHAAGDMWCHTFVNKYAGGVWPSIVKDGLDIPRRHIIVESYMNDITGSIGTQALRDASANIYQFQHDDQFHKFLYETFIEDSWARNHDPSYLFGFFRYLRGQLVAAKGSDWVTKIDAIIDAFNDAPPPPPPAPPPPDLMKLGDFFDNWISSIDDGLREWVKTSSLVANSIFIWSAWEQGLGWLRDWGTRSLPGMLGAPEGVQDIINALATLSDKINMDLEDVKNKLFEDVPALKDLYDGLMAAKDDFRDWIFKRAFGMTFDELKAFWLNPLTYLTAPEYCEPWFGGALYGYGCETKSELDSELAYALSGGSFDAEKFDASYNTLMATKLLLLDGPTLNTLAANQGYWGPPLYGPGGLEEPQMCAMLGFIRSLDADHQWMNESPIGQAWGGGGGRNGPGEMRFWEDSAARERVFKKVFHLGLDMEMATSGPLVLAPGSPGSVELTLVNTGNRADAFHLDLTWSTGNPLLACSLEEGNRTEVFPGAPQTVAVTITAPRDCHMAPGLYDFTLQGTSVGRAWKLYDLVPTKSESGMVRVLPFFEPDVEAAPGSQTTAPGGTRSYMINLTNKGNVPDSFGITPTYEDFGNAYFSYPTAIQPGWVSIGTTAMELVNCGAQSTGLSITIPGDWAGMDETTYTARITARSRGDAEAEDSDTIAIIVQPTKESKTRYLDLELLWIRDLVSASAIETSVKQSLFEQLAAAIMKKEQGLDYLLKGRNKQADNMLNACQEIVKAFMNLVEAQNGKAIPSATATDLIVRAGILRGHIGATIATE